MNDYPINSQVWWNGKQWEVIKAEGEVRRIKLGNAERVLSVYSLNKVPANNGGQYTITEPRR